MMYTGPKYTYNIKKKKTRVKFNDISVLFVVIIVVIDIIVSWNTHNQKFWICEN